MKYTKGDIVEINFYLPDGRFKPHPAVIVSNDTLQASEGFIYLAMISSKAYNPQYSYALTPEMLTKPMPKESFVKCQIIVGNIERDVLRRISKIKQPYLDQIIRKIILSVF